MARHINKYKGTAHNVKIMARQTFIYALPCLDVAGGPLLV